MEEEGAKNCYSLSSLSLQVKKKPGENIQKATELRFFLQERKMQPVFKPLSSS